MHSRQTPMPNVPLKTVPADTPDRRARPKTLLNEFEHSIRAAQDAVSGMVRAHLRPPRHGAAGADAAAAFCGWHQSSAHEYELAVLRKEVAEREDQNWGASRRGAARRSGRS